METIAIIIIGAWIGIIHSYVSDIIHAINDQNEKIDELIKNKNTTE